MNRLKSLTITTKANIINYHNVILTIMRRADKLSIFVHTKFTYLLTQVLSFMFTMYFLFTDTLVTKIISVISIYVTIRLLRDYINTYKTLTVRFRDRARF